MESSWADKWVDAPGLLGQGFQSDERVMSPPKHMVKLPYWSSEWYCRYRREVAHFMYVSYIGSLVSCLPLLIMPCFGSEAELDVLFFPYQPRPHVRCP